MKSASSLQVGLPQTIVEYVRAEIRKRIITLKYPPGFALREVEIQAELGGSRGAVREALRMVLRSGLVEYRPRRGFWVMNFSRKEIEHIYKLRAQLEAMLIDELQDVPDGKLPQALRTQIALMKELASDHKVIEYFFQNIEFHRMIIMACHNRPLRQIVECLDEMSLPVRYLLIHREETVDRSMEGHVRLVTALEQGCHKDASELVRSIILSNLEKVKELEFPSEAPRPESLTHERSTSRLSDSYPFRAGCKP